MLHKIVMTEAAFAARPNPMLTNCAASLPEAPKPISKSPYPAPALEMLIDIPKPGLAIAAIICCQFPFVPAPAPDVTVCAPELSDFVGKLDPAGSAAMMAATSAA